MNPRFIYVAPCRLPGDFAHGLQIVMICEAFSQHTWSKRAEAIAEALRGAAPADPVAVRLSLGA